MVEAIPSMHEVLGSIPSIGVCVFHMELQCLACASEPYCCELKDMLPKEVKEFGQIKHQTHSKGEISNQIVSL